MTGAIFYHGIQKSLGVQRDRQQVYKSIFQCGDIFYHGVQEPLGVQRVFFYNIASFLYGSIYYYVMEQFFTVSLGLQCGVTWKPSTFLLNANLSFWRYKFAAQALKNGPKHLEIRGITDKFFFYNNAGAHTQSVAFLQGVQQFTF